MSPSWTKDALARRLEPLVSSYFPAHGEISVVVGILAGGQRYFLTYHRLEQKDRPPVEEDTIFEIGSTTMAFTSCLLADMAVKRQLQLTDPVRTFLPSRVRVPSYRGQEITLLDLANHSSALPRLPSNFPETVIDPANPCRDYTLDHLYAFLAGHRLQRPMGWRRDYSNLGMGLLGYALGLAAHQQYEDAIAERICRPLELHDTTVTLTATQRTRFIAGHSAMGKPASPWDMPAMVGAGGLRSTARDLLRFLETHLGKEGPLQAAVQMCRTPRPKTGRYEPWVLRYGFAVGLSTLALAGLWYLGPVPGSGGFLGLFLLPVLLAALYGGLGPGCLTAVSQTVVAWFLCDEGFNGPFHGVAGLSLAWLVSSNDRERTRPECLGWQQTNLGLVGLGPAVLWHSGETGGYASFIGFTKGREIATVVLANCAKPLANLGFRVLEAVNER